VKFSVKRINELMKNEKGLFGESPKATAKIKMQKSKIKMQNDNEKCKKKSL